MSKRVTIPEEQRSIVQVLIPEHARVDENGTLYSEPPGWGKSGEKTFTELTRSIIYLRCEGFTAPEVRETLDCGKSTVANAFGYFGFLASEDMDAYQASEDSDGKLYEILISGEVSGREDLVESTQSRRTKEEIEREKDDTKQEEESGEACCPSCKKEFDAEYKVVQHARSPFTDCDYDFVLEQVDVKKARKDMAEVQKEGMEQKHEEESDEKDAEVSDGKEDVDLEEVPIPDGSGELSGREWWHVLQLLAQSDSKESDRVAVKILESF